MVIDAVTEALFGRAFDRGGKIAAEGLVLKPVLEQILKRKFFRAKPPKTAGREEFGREFVRDFLRQCAGFRKEDVVATATALTARSIGDAVRRFVIREARARNNSFREMILSGGGARNATLVAMLTEDACATRNPVAILRRIRPAFQAKEAVAFAVLAYETWNRRPSNVPSATGAKRAAVLGKISYA